MKEAREPGVVHELRLRGDGEQVDQHFVVAEETLDRVDHVPVGKRYRSLK